MATENLRDLTDLLKAALIENVAFSYAHLVKFERPKRASQFLGESSNQAKDYAYITDASYDILFDDGSGNGAQVYRANKLLKLSNANETVKAKASTMSLVLDSSTLDSKAISPTINVASGISSGNQGQLTSSDTNFVEEGFREGDKVSLNLSTTSYEMRIETFTNDGKGFILTNIMGSGLAVPSINNVQYDNLSLVSEELTALITNKVATTYTSYINRDIEVVKIFTAVEDVSLDVNKDGTDETVVLAGGNLGNYLMFKGIISNANITDGPSRSEITWVASSHWADFNRVQGRRTEDTSHRALDSDGLPNREATVTPAYADDLGFLHATRSVNLTAVYNRTETRTEVDYDSGFLGIGAGVDTREVEYDVPTELDLKFNMQAKFLPVVYGVQRIDSIPMFADTRFNLSTQVHALYGLAEGRITGLYDLQLDGHSSICMDKQDYDVRGTIEVAEDADGTIDFLCKGFQNYGNTLVGYDASSGQAVSQTTSAVGQNDFSFDGKSTGVVPQFDDFKPVVFKHSERAIGNNGILHELTHSFDSPIDCHLTFHSGKAYQKANNRMVSIAQAANADERFKVQRDYYNQKEVYWGPNHRLLDTAYLHAEFRITEGETKLPKFKAVVKGVSVECFNYDHSYALDISRLSSNTSQLKNFQIGDQVQLFNTVTTSEITSSTPWVIHDRWFFYDAEGSKNYRFIIKNSVGEYPTILSTGRFYIQVSGVKLYFAAYGAKAHGTDKSVGAALSTTISGRGAQQISISSASNAVKAALALSGASVKLLSSKNDSFIHANFSGFDYNSNTLDDLGSNVTWTNDIISVIIGNGIQLDSSATGSDNVYNGARITVTRNFDDGTKYTQTRKIVDYNGSNKVAVVDSPWDGGYIPGVGEPTNADTYNIELGVDERPSINPAMQMMDYLRSKRYGKGLKLTDIDLPSFIASGRECDQQSTVTVVGTSAAVGTLEKGAVYTYGTAGTAGYFRGTVYDVETTARNIGGALYKQVTFSNVIGKLGRKFNKYTNFATNELIWENGVAKAATSGYMTGGFGTGGNLTTATLTKLTSNQVAKNGPTSLVIDVSIFKSGNGNPIAKSFTTNFNSYSASGYSLYDSDDIKYWKYVGWDYPDQRNVTRHQMNQSINTSQPLFTNVNKMLDQFNGMLRYSSGKYSLAIKSKQPSTFDPLEIFEAGDIIGTLKLTDSGSKKTYNTAQLSFPDPQNKFENREIGFFDSNFLKEDKGVPKNLSYQVRGITNYFNARFNVVQKIKESRYGLTVNFQVGPRGLALIPGEVIQLSYPRFGFESKSFRVLALTFTADCLVNVTAAEHNEDAYIVENVQEDVTGGTFQLGGVPIKQKPTEPSGLTASSNSPGGITLVWAHSASFSPLTHNVEIWRGTGSTRSTTTNLTAAATNPTAATTAVVVSDVTGISAGDSVVFRNSPAGLKVAVGGVNTSTNTLTLDQAVEIPLNVEGSSVETVPDLTTSEVDSVGTIPTISARTQLTFFKAIKIHTTSGDENEYVDPVISSDSTVTRYYWVRYSVRTQELSAGAIKTTEKFSSFEPVGNGVSATSQSAAAPRSVQLIIGGSNQTGNVVTYDEDSANPSPSNVTVTATPTNISDAANVTYVYASSSDGSTFTDYSSGVSTNVLSYQPPASLGALPEIIRVTMTDQIPGGPTYVSTDQITILGTRTTPSLITASLNLAGPYSTFRDLTIGAFHKSGNATISLDTTAGNFLSDGQSLEVKATGADAWVYFNGLPGGTSLTNSVPITPGLKYVLSAFVKLNNTNSPSTSNNAQLYIRHNGAASNNHERGTVLNHSVPADGAWHRIETFIDLSASTNGKNTADALTIRVDNDSFSSNGTTTMYFDNVQLEVRTQDADASQFTPASGGAYTVQQTLPTINFSANALGAVGDVTAYINRFIVSKDGAAYTYDASTPTDQTNSYSPRSYRFGTIVESQSNYGSGAQDDIKLSVTSSGQISVETGSNSPFLSANSVDSCHVDVPVIDNGTNLIVITMRLTFTKTLQGTIGVTAKTVSLRASQQIIEYNVAGTGGTGNITLTADGNNYTDAYFKFTDNFSAGYTATNQSGFSDGDSANVDTATFAIPTNYSSTPYTFTVEAREGATGSTIATDTVTIAALKPSADGEDGTSGGIIDLTLGGDAAFSSTGVLSKTGTNSGWAHQAYSTVGYSNGTAVTFRVLGTGRVFMAGLDSSPSTNTYPSLDYVFYFPNTGNVKVYESGVDRGEVVSTYSTGDIFSVVYDNQTIKYYHNGTVVRTVVVGEGRTFFFDSSIVTHSNVGLIDSITIAPTGKAGGVGRNIDWNFTDMEMDDLGRLRKTGTTDGWNAQAYSTDAYTGGASVSFRGLSANKSYAMGLNTDPTTNAELSSLDYSFYLVYNGTVHLRLNNTSITNPATNSTTWLSSRSANDLFTVVYNNKDVKWYHNGVLLHTVAAAADKKFYVDSSQHSIGNEFVIDNVSFGPVGAAGTPGGTPELNFTNAAINDQGQIYKTSDTTSWNAQAYSTIGYSDGAVLTFKVLQHNRKLMVGFSETPTTNASFTHIDYAIYCDGTGQRKAYESGSGAGVDPSAADGQISTGDILSLVYDNSTVKYYHNGLLYRTAQVGAGKTFFLDSSFDSYNSGNPQIGNVTFSPSAAAGTDGITVILSNETHTFPASNGGNVAASAYAGGNTLISVYDGVTQLDYDGSGSTAQHFTVSASATGITGPSIADSGNNASMTGFSAFTDALSTATVTYTITGKRVNGTALPSIIKVQTFSKANAGSNGNGHRGLSSFVFEESTSDFHLNNTTVSQANHAAYFAVANFHTHGSTDVAKNIAALVIAHPDSDGEIRPGDRVTITDNSANVAATRLWDGSVLTNAVTASRDNFSSLVVETFPGSVIVDGTLSAGKIQANSVTATNFNVGSNIVVGTTNTAGAIYSSGKTSATSTTNGFYLGWAANNTPVFAIGGGGTGVAGTTLNNNGITVRDTGGTIRVKIGDLDLL